MNSVHRGQRLEGHLAEKVQSQEVALAGSELRDRVFERFAERDPVMCFEEIELGIDLAAGVQDRLVAGALAPELAQHTDRGARGRDLQEPSERSAPRVADELRRAAVAHQELATDLLRDLLAQVVGELHRAQRAFHRAEVVRLEALDRGALPTSAGEREGELRSGLGADLVDATWETGERSNELFRLHVEFWPGRGRGFDRTLERSGQAIEGRVRPLLEVELGEVRHARDDT